jgi:hypothetical protein
MELEAVDTEPSRKKEAIYETTLRQSVRSFQSQPQLRLDQKSRRYFSFEPGEDHLQALNEELTKNDTLKLPKDMSMTATSSDCSDPHGVSVVTPPGVFTSPYQIPGHDPHNHSKIPSPVQAYGNVRRQTSISSLQSIMTKSNDGRHASHSSIQTALRRPRSRSRSSSFNNLHGTDASPSSKDRSGSVRVRNSVTSLASDPTSYKAVSPGDSPTRNPKKAPATCPSIRTVRNMGQHTQENDDPSIRG